MRRRKKGTNERRPLSGAATLASLAVASALFLGGALRVWRAGDMPGIDVYQYWIGAKIAATHRGENFYDPHLWQAAAAEEREAAITSGQSRLTAVADERRELELYGTPFLFTAAALLPDNYETAHAAYRAVSLAAIALTLVAAALVGGWGVPGALATAGGVLLLCAPLHSDVRVGNVNSIQAALVLTACLLIGRRRSWSLLSAGVLFALAAMLKPNVALAPVAIVLLMAATRRTRSALLTAAGAAGGALLGAVSSILYFGREAVWLDWYRLFSALPPSIIPRSSGNISFAHELGAAVGADVSIPLFVIGAALLGWALWRQRKSVDAESSLESVAFAGMAVLVTLFSSDLVWLHYAVLVLAAAVALTGPRSAPSTRILAAVVLLLVAYEPLFRLLQFDWARWQLPLINLGMGLLFATAGERPVPKHG